MYRMIRNKWVRVLLRAPVLLLALLLCVFWQPATAHAETEALEKNMDHFTRVGCYNAIESSGENLNRMFDFTNGKLNEKSQYVAWYSIDRQKTSNISWSTHTVYLHDGTWGTTTFTEDSNRKDDIVLKLVLKGDRKTKGSGKLTFYKYSDTLDGKHQSVGSGKVGTLFYFCVDAKTDTGRKFQKYLDKNDGTVSLKMSPIIQCSQGELWRSADAWMKGHGWSDQNRSNYTSHYDVPIRFELDTIKVSSVAFVVGDLLTEKSKVQYGATDRQLSGKDLPRQIKKSDGIHKPGSLLSFLGEKADSIGGMPTISVGGSISALAAYMPVDENEAIEISNPAAGKKGKNKTVKTKDSNGKEVSMICVGYSLSKIQNDDTEVVLASSMLELEKDSAGQYVPLYVDDKTGKKVQVDTTADGEKLSIPAKVYNRTVTVARYNAYAVGGKGERDTDDYFDRGDEVTVAEWLDEVNREVTWCMNNDFGIPVAADSKNPEAVRELVLKWFYAPAGTVGETAGDINITLESYYSTETTNIQTGEYPSVDDSSDLQYSHESVNHKLYRSEVIDTVNDGDPWVSYSVKKNKEGQYVLKDGSVSPKKRLEGEESMEATGSPNLEEDFADTNPVCDFTKKDLTEINNEKTGLTVPKIPYILAKNGEVKSADAALTNYLYRVVVTTDEDDVWTEFTAEDIWGDVRPACGTVIKGKSDNRSYTTNAPYMKAYVIQESEADRGLIKKRNSDWQKDVFNMTHFILPEVRCNVTIKAYYTTTVPVQTYVYRRDSSGDFTLQPSLTTVAWVSPGVNYRNSFDGNATAVIAATGRKAGSIPYTTVDRKKNSFSSVDKAQKYYPDRINIHTTTDSFSVMIKDEPVVVCVFIDNEKPAKYFTQVQYVHTQDGKYHLVKAWRQPIRTLKAKVDCSVHYCGEEDCPGHYYSNPSTTVKAFVSFPEYVSWDDGNTGLYGSLYSGQVLSTQGSSAYQAQTAIPTTDVVRAVANVPRYLTGGYWTRHNFG